MLQEIQKFDYDRYLSIIFSSKDKREDIMSVILFNLEIARIKSKVSEQMMGLIRLQWWREAIEEIFDESKTPRRHNVVQRLKELTQKYKLNKDDFLTVINAREKDLDESPFATEAEFNEYLFNTSYPINKIILDVLDIHDSNIIAATKDISIAWAMCAVIRSAHRNFGTGRAVFPQDLMAKHNVNIDDVGKPEFIENSKPLVIEFYNKAEGHINTAIQLIKNAAKADVKTALPVLLNINTTQHHLKQIKNNDYDIFTKNLNPYLGFFSLINIYFKQL